MIKIRSIAILALTTISISSMAQTTKNKKMTNETAKTNPLLCDPQTGICEMPAGARSDSSKHISQQSKPVKIIYFTDPICSSCWGIEPQLRKLKLEYGNDVAIEYHMGGLLPDWSYNSGGISKPSDVAHHWDEVSAYYKMPIDGDVWLEDPLDSSYPPSIAFKAAQLQSEDKALKFLRIMREMVFMQKKNIAKWQVMEQAAEQAGLDKAQLKIDYDGQAKELFQKDLQLAKEFGVRGFPTVFVVDGKGAQEKVYGSKPYADFEQGIKTVYPTVKKQGYNNDWTSLFAKYPTLTTREFAELSDISYEAGATLLEQLSAENKIGKMNSKNGMLWLKK